MKYQFAGQFVQATAETLDENIALMALRQPAKAPGRGTNNAKAWVTRRKKYGHNGRGFVAPDGEVFKNKGSYNKAIAARKRWEATPEPQRKAVISRLQNGRAKQLA